MKYRVRFFMDNDYEVFELTPNDKYNEDDYTSEEQEFNEESVFQGSLSDCEAYIRLNEKGYM